MIEDFTEAELQEVRAEQQAYLKEWRANNPDKVRAYNRKYWLKKARAKKGFTPMEWTEPIQKTPQK